MKDLSSFWRKTQKNHQRLENNLVNNYIAFLRKVVKVYLKQGRRIFFKENRIVHWGEWCFGELLIEGKEDVRDVFGEYISEIRFTPEINGKTEREYIEIREGNLKDIKYELR